MYDLIVHRFLALFYPAYSFETIQFTFDLVGETFTARETVVIDYGFKQIMNIKRNDEQVRKSSALIQVGQSLSVSNLHLKTEMTEAPPRFTESDLLTRMEKYGLGTPATRADIIERLLSSEVIQREHQRLHPTPKGKQLIELVNDELKSPQLTAKWEAELEAIAKGNGNPKKFLQNIRKQTKKLVYEIKQSDHSYKAHNLTGSKCSKCGSFMKEVRGKDGRLLVCSNRDCNYRRRKDPKLSNRRCSQCRKRMEIHQGKAGMYFQCRRCNIVEKAEKRQRAVTKREERKLLKKYSKEESFGNSLADALNAALKEKK